MKILHNPNDGAEIKDVFYKDVKYFNSKEDQIFKVGSIFAFEDDAVGDFFKNLYEFLREVTPSEARKLNQDQPVELFKCDQSGCSFKTNTKIALAGHKRTHTTDLGIPVISAHKKEEVIEDTYTKGEKEDQQAGLIGKGLEIDRVVQI